MGEAERLRIHCRSGQLICPIPDCDSPRLTTRAGSKRDHFAHLSGGGHGPETLFHYTAKALIGTWARQRYPEAAVSVDLQTVESGRQPDVLVEFDGKRRFAFEIQYAGLTEDGWRRRHADYKRDGVVDVWLFGHTRRFLRPARSDFYDQPAGRYTLGPLLQTVDHATGHVLWIDPDQQQILIRRRFSGAGHDSWTKTGILPTVEVAAVDLDECRLEDGGLWTPIAPDEVEGKRMHDQREREARAEAAAEERQWRAERRQERQERDRVAAARASQRGLWQRYRAKLIARYGAVPLVLSVTHRFDAGLLLESPHWHGVLVGAFLNDKVGQLFTNADVLEFFSSRGLTDSLAAPDAAIEEYLFILRRHGFIDFAARGPFLESPALVLTDLRNPPTEDAALRLRLQIRGRTEEDELRFATELRSRLESQTPQSAERSGALERDDSGSS